jgi:hypothetical protein
MTRDEWINALYERMPDGFSRASVGMIVDDLILPALPVWQPIETAPKEHGEYVLLWIPGKNRRAIGWWDRDRYSKRPRPFWIWTIGSRHSISDCRANPPTHWQHLPMPPEGK